MISYTPINIIILGLHLIIKCSIWFNKYEFLSLRDICSWNPYYFVQLCIVTCSVTSCVRVFMTDRECDPLNVLSFPTSVPQPGMWCRGRGWWSGEQRGGGAASPSGAAKGRQGHQARVSLQHLKQNRQQWIQLSVQRVMDGAVKILLVTQNIFKGFYSLQLSIGCLCVLEFC